MQGGQVGTADMAVDAVERMDHLVGGARHDGLVRRSVATGAGGVELDDGLAPLMRVDAAVRPALTAEREGRSDGGG